VNDNGIDNGTNAVPHRSPRPTIKAVASAAGVSTQTVSRVINERPDVSPVTRKRVQDIIDQLGYRPSALARSLIRQRSYALGVVTAGLKFIGPSRTLNGITGAAEALGYSLLLKEQPRFDSNDVSAAFQKLLARHVDGIIWAVPEVGDNRSWVDAFSPDLDVPVVYLTMQSRPGLNIVSVDNYTGARTAVEHLIEQGYRHIGHITGPLDWWEARQRMAAWRDALSEAGLQLDDRACVEGNWSSASGAQAIQDLHDQYPEMDAVFVANDQMALSVLQYACRTGLSIPNDLGIIGFDNIPEGAFFWPPLTTVDQDQIQLGRTAVEGVIRIIESAWDGYEPDEPRAVLIEPTLVIRRSSLRRKSEEKEVSLPDDE
jgi:LacI family transcriptional regulator